jgi:hypothetical protein
MGSDSMLSGRISLASRVHARLTTRPWWLAAGPPRVLAGQAEPVG